MTISTRKVFESESFSSISSSITKPDSLSSGSISFNFSSLSSSSSNETSLPYTLKPHITNHPAWSAMNQLLSEHGEVKVDHFQFLRKLGSGDTGKVYKCKIDDSFCANVIHDQCLYAIKVVDIEAAAMKKKLNRVDMEREILRMLNHPFLPTLYAEFETKKYSCLIMDYCSNGDLFTLLQQQPGCKLSISNARFYAAEVLVALEYLHMMGIIYRDLKPENVLVREDGHIMLSDFDLSFICKKIPKTLSLETKDKPFINCVPCFSFTKKQNPKFYTTMLPHFDHKTSEKELCLEPTNARSNSFVGTHEYLSPEMILGKSHGSGVDWWAFGVFLYELLFGKTPFRGQSNEKTLKNIVEKPLDFPKVCSRNKRDYEEIKNAQDLIRKLLVKDPRKRLGNICGSAEIKKHQFFKGVNWALIRSVKPPKIVHKTKS
ncbi:hypothetical protein ACFE04_031946 [Oxalis oulophora]